MVCYWGYDVNRKNKGIEIQSCRRRLSQQDKRNTEENKDTVFNELLYIITLIFSESNSNILGVVNDVSVFVVRDTLSKIICHN